MNIIQLIASLSILVFIHELGHFFFARFFGTRVEKFYLFFNPWFSLFKWQSRRSGTIYGLGWLPLGGYCQIAGMVDESMDMEQLKQPPKADEFRSKKAWQRLLIMAGGIIFNLILAFLLYVMISFAWGDKHLDTRQVKDGWSFSPTAEAIGFVDGDIFVSIDGKEGLNALAGLTEQVISAKQVEVLRGGERHSIQIPSDFVQRILRDGQGFASINVPFIIKEVVGSRGKLDLQEGDRLLAISGIKTPYLAEAFEALDSLKGRDVSLSILRGNTTLEVYAQISPEGKLGVALQSAEEIFPTETIHYSLISAIPAGWDKALTTISSYVSSLKHIFTKEGAKSLGGLGTMSKLFPKGFNWQAFWLTTAFLSIILAVMNLLPIPALDGGHIVILLIEMLSGRKPSDKVMGYIQMTGLIFLIALMLYANGNDIYRYLIKG